MAPFSSGHSGHPPRYSRHAPGVPAAAGVERQRAFLVDARQARVVLVLVARPPTRRTQADVAGGRSSSGTAWCAGSGCRPFITVSTTLSACHTQGTVPTLIVRRGSTHSEHRLARPRAVVGAAPKVEICWGTGRCGL